MLGKMHNKSPFHLRKGLLLFDIDFIPADYLLFTPLYLIDSNCLYVCFSFISDVSTLHCSTSALYRCVSTLHCSTSALYRCVFTLHCSTSALYRCVFTLHCSTSALYRCVFILYCCFISAPYPPCILYANNRTT